MEAPIICEQFRFVGVECLAPVGNGRTKAKTRSDKLATAHISAACW